MSTWILGSAVIYHLTDNHHQLLHKQRKMVDSSKSTSAYKTLIGLRDKITHLNGIIMPEGVDKLKFELGGV